MATYNTGNPLGSTDPRDLYDNSQGLDKAVNDTEGDTWTDRFGVVRPTIQKALNDLAVSAGLAYETLEELQAVTGTQGQIAEVTNDGENTGRYWWNNGAWEMMSPGALAEIEETNKRLLEVSRAAGLEQEVDEFAYAMGDENDKFGYGLKDSGNIAVNNIEMESAGNDAGTTGIVDEDDKLAVEINESGQTGVSALYFFPMAGENFRIVDDEEKNAYILDDDGNSLFSLSHDRIEYFRILSTVGLLTQRGLSLPENGSLFLQGNASLTADRYLSDVSGELRPYLQRTDIVDGSYIYESRKIRYHLSAGQSLAVERQERDTAVAKQQTEARETVREVENEINQTDDAGILDRAAPWVRKPGASGD